MTLDIKNLSAGYGKTPVITGIHMTAATGRICAVMGMGQDITRMARHRIAQIISVVPQVNFSPFSFSCLDMVLMAGTARIRAWSAPSRKEQDRAASAMADVGIDHLTSQAFNTISGGERQLVMLARALFQETPIMLLDEPTAHLDFTNQHRIMALMRKLVKKRQMTVIITLHDPNLTYHYCDDVVLIHQGRVAAAGKTVDTLTSEVLTQVLGDNIRLDITTGGVRVAVPESFDLNSDMTKPSLSKTLTTHQEKRVV